MSTMSTSLRNGIQEQLLNVCNELCLNNIDLDNNDTELLERL